MTDNETKQHIDKLIERYVRGTIHRDSLRELRRWADASAEHREYVRRQIEVMFSLGVATDSTPFDSSAAYGRFRERVASTGGMRFSASGKRRMPRWKVAVAAVAAVLVVVALPLIGYHIGRNGLQAAFADIVVEAPMGGRMRMTLPDSTHVWLNSGSRIVYSQGFGVADRRLKLEGEAYFEVAHNPDKPFCIATRELGVRVVGTKFNLRNYPSDSELAVSLVEGCVALYNRVCHDSTVLLRPMQCMVMDKRTGQMTLRDMSTRATAAWTGNELFFDEDLLPDIAKKIERSYNVRVHVADSVRGRRFYGSFRLTANTPDDILRAISATGNVSCRKTRAGYELY